MINFEEALGHFNTGKVWFGWESPEAEKNYDNLVVIDETATKPTEEEINAKIVELQFIEDRKNNYPSLVEFAEAYTEKEILGDSAKWDAYVEKYNQVRTDYPKP